MLDRLSQLIVNPATWIGFGAGALLMLIGLLCLVALVGRANEDLPYPDARSGPR